MNKFVRTPRRDLAQTRRAIAAEMFDEADERRDWLERTLLRPGQVAALLQVSRRTVATWARAGVLPSLATPGGHRRFRAADVRALVERLRLRPSRTGV